ncbi:caspase family protein [Actinoplanes sp. RD1]|uniref:caspase family protein n=1 Tax=Actinoplanes sp. RD1 TaxID=3064538 RepID=UPI002741F9FD|nr:caspase family protein [Actinoplanes sp. RD1]
MGLPDPKASRAVLVGVSRYKYLPPLPAVANNVTALSELLTSGRGWQLPPAHCVTLLDPPSASTVLHKIHTAARQATSGLLIYFAGHGLLDDSRGDLHLALSRSDQSRLHDAVPFALIRREIVRTAIRCPAKVILIDTCFSGAAMTGFMGGGAVADLAVTDGAYLMTASDERRPALAPEGERYTAFTGALVNVLRRGVPGGPPLLDMDTIFDRVRMELRARDRPEPQSRSRNQGSRIVLAPNKVAAPKAAPATAGRGVTGADLDTIRGALIMAAQGGRLVAKSKAGQVIREACPHVPAANWAGAGSLGRFVDTHLPDLRPRPGDPDDHLRVRPPSGPGPKASPAPKAISGAKATAVPAPKAIIGPKQPAKPKRPAGRRKTPPARAQVPLPAPSRPAAGKGPAGRRIRIACAGVVVAAALGWAGQQALAYLGRTDGPDPTLTVTRPVEGPLTQERYTVRVSRPAPAGRQLVAMLRDATPGGPGTWWFYRCTATADGGAQCKSVPLGKKGKPMQVAIVEVDAARGTRLLANDKAAPFRGAPEDLGPYAVSRVYSYRR